MLVVNADREEINDSMENYLNGKGVHRNLKYECGGLKIITYFSIILDFIDLCLI